jgi:hypothetical protein
MGDKKGKAPKDDKKIKPEITNDQLGENAGEGRFLKADPKSGKKR